MAVKYDSYTVKKNNNDLCTYIDPIDPVAQTEFNGKYLCGIEGGSPFTKVTRVDPQTKECPAGT